MSQQRQKNRISIGLYQLPKLRQKSAHFCNRLLKDPIQTKQQQQPKPRPYNSSQSKQKKVYSKVQESLSRYRSQFHQLSNMSKSLLNSTFYRVSQEEDQFEKSKKLLRKKVFKMQKQTESGEDPRGDCYRNSAKKGSVQPHTGPTFILDYKIQMSFLNNLCLDGGFSLSRVGATLSFQDNCVYLFGGCPDSSQNNLAFHKFNLSSNLWQHVNSLGQKPVLSLIYHTTNTYKDNFVFCGGMSIDKTQLKKLNNPHINIFNSQTYTWSKFNWDKFIKNHSSCIINNVLVVHGGINERQKTQNQLYFVHLNFEHLIFSKLTSFNTNQYLSHHKMITTMNEDIRLRDKFKIDGIIMFGGKNIEQNLSNELYYLQSDSFKINNDNMRITKKWQVIETQGSKPAPRMCHTFDLLPNKGLSILIGGINDKNQYLNDMWVFDLFGITWTRVEQVPLLELTGGIAYHSTVTNASQIYVYGGITKNKTNKHLYMIQTQKSKRQYQKNQSRKRLEISSNIISFKALQ